MTDSADISWYDPLELKLRRLNSNAFQTYFGDLMEEAHGNDFIRMRSYGRLGDGGCDGLRRSTGTVYACYGALNGSAPNISSVVSKINDDFTKANSELADLMKSWRFTHNMIEGLHKNIEEAVKALESQHPEIEFGYFGPSDFRELFHNFSEGQRLFFLHNSNSKYYRQPDSPSHIASNLPNLNSAMDQMSDVDRDIRPKIMGYCSWFYPCEKEYMIELLGEQGFARDIVNAQMEQLRAHGIVALTRKHILPQNKQACDEAAQLFTDEFIDLL